MFTTEIEKGVVIEHFILETVKKMSLSVARHLPERISTSNVYPIRTGIIVRMVTFKVSL